MSPAANRHAGRPYLVGLTGGLASGKSTVARLLAGHGFTVVDADRLVADLYAPGGRGARALEEIFGAEALDDDGAVDKQALAQRIFHEPEARAKVEDAIHPLVYERFREIVEDAAERGESVVVYEATLLVESGHAERFDHIVTVEADPELRLERAVERGMDESDARARLAAQGDGAARREAADVVLRNDGTLAELEENVAALADDLARRAARRS